MIEPDISVNLRSYLRLSASIFKKMLSKSKKFILSIALICFIVTGAVFAFSRPAKAFFGDMFSGPTIIAMEVQKNVKKTVGATIMQAGTIALVNAMNSFAQKLAYDAATWIAAGDWGEKPFFDGKSAGEYFKDAAFNGLGGFIGDMSADTVGKLGFNLCAPSVSMLMKLQVGLAETYTPTTPSCDWKTIAGNWESFIGGFKTGETLSKVGLMFEGGQSGLNFAFDVQSKTLAKLEEEEKKHILNRFEGKGWKGVKDIVTGNIKTPADTVKESFGKSYFDHVENQQVASFGAFGDALGRGALQILPTALSTFANTLLSQSLAKLTGGLFLSDLWPDEEDPFASILSQGAPASPAIGRRKAEQVYSDLLTPRVAVSTNYDPLIEFVTCPSGVEKQVNHCVLDSSFAAAINLAAQGAPITIAEAVKKGYLDENKPLISSKDSRNEKSDCYQNGYCYSNLVKLRKARILPVGFELAAETVTSGAFVRLKTVLAGFDKCNSEGQRDSGHPYCHLVNPNWVLRMPKVQCKAMVYGPTLVSSEGSLRAKQCVDTVSCISEDENGKCTGGWGYCTREKNIWRIAADKCDEHYNTCLSYKTRATKKTETYLRNTVDFGACVASNVGCRPYSANQKNGAWSNSLGDQIYFNKDIVKCDSKDAGCTELYSKDKGLEYNLLLNSSFEKKIINNWKQIGEADIQSDAYDGSSAILIAVTDSKGMETAQLLKLELNTAYALSVYAKQASAGDTIKARVGVSLFTDKEGKKPFDAKNLITTCNTIQEIGDALETETAQLYQSETPGDSYGRISCAFLIPNQTLYAKVFLAPEGEDGKLLFDAIQLEEGVSASAYLSEGYGTVSSKYLKIPPNYLSCDADTNDLRCNNYAKTCKETEVGCEKYTPKDKIAPAISGIATINDVCPAACAGYETYKQEKTLFETEKFPLYFIPKTAKTCNANEAGCDEFTNIETEAKEYFSFIRQCIKPGDAEDATFYTWEGSDTTGYQLKSHKLKTGPSLTAEEKSPDFVGPVPAYIKGVKPSECTNAIFTKKVGEVGYNADCREFYNANGKISYRLLYKSIISTKDCAKYRKTESSQSDCDASGGFWDLDKGYCVYNGYKKESTTCGSSANGCRAYSGAASSNLRIVLQDGFEAGANNWDNGTVSSEAVSAGGHSLKSIATVGTSVTIGKEVAALLGANSAYTLSFWAKAPAGGNLEAKFSHSSTNSYSAGLKGDWKFYQAGPFYTGSSIDSATKLQFVLTKGAGFYIDNIILKEVSQNLYLIKNSWSTPASCDQTTGGLYLPQAMLGCREYTDTNKNTVYLKSFSSLCRDSAIGCKSFQNTHNSASDKNEIYNAICARADKTGGTCGPSDKPLCQIGAGNSICRFKITDGKMPENAYKQSSYKDYGAFQDAIAEVTKSKDLTHLIVRDESTVEVPADKIVYMVSNKKFECKAKELGCSALGQPKLYTTPTAGGSNVYYKNTPDKYNKLLCAKEAEGCESWTSAKGIDYFKVPEKTCEYKEGVINAGGWYKEGTTTACYSGFKKDGEYGMWKNADDEYDGSVGICPSKQSGCTEFVDPQDTSPAHIKGQPYYLIDNQKLQALERDRTCSGSVSLEKGCILFNKTSDTSLKWNAKATYFEAQKEKKLVSPITAPKFCEYEAYGKGTDANRPCLTGSDCPPKNTQFDGSTILYTGECAAQSPAKYDSNTILKVTRDRECGEWLACKSSYSAFDPLTKEKIAICSDMGLCNKYKKATGNASVCSNFISISPDTGKLLTSDYYSSRKTTWEGMDYSGISMGNKYPILDMRVENVAGTAEATAVDLRLYAAPQKKSGEFITFEKYNLDGTKYSKDRAEKLTCRAYPEQDAPFSENFGNFEKGFFKGVKYQAQGYRNANICEDNQKECGCDYTKVTYGSKVITKYIDYGQAGKAELGICQGGKYDGMPCTPGVKYENAGGDKTKEAKACGDPLNPTESGSCISKKRWDDVIGWQGFCLERDLATIIDPITKQNACLTWLPYQIPGAKDMYNQFRSAGYDPPANSGRYYCLQAAGRYDIDSKNTKNRYDNFIATKQATEGPPSLSYLPRGICVKAGITKTGDMGFQSGIRSVCATNQGDILKWPSNIPKQLMWPTPPIPKNRSIAFITDDEILGEGDGFLTYGKFEIDEKTSNISKVHKDEIDLIRIKTIPGTNFNKQGFPAPDTVFFIRPDKEITYAGSATDACNGNDKLSDCKGEDEGKYGLSDNNQKAYSKAKDDAWYFFYDDGQSDGGGDPREYNYASKGGTNMFFDLFEKKYTEQKDNENRWVAVWKYCDNGNEKTHDAFALRFNLDKKTGFFKDIEMLYCNAGGDGEYNIIELEISFRMKELCTTVVDVAMAKNRALTNVIWEDNPLNKTAPLKTIPVLGYTYKHEEEPFGSADSSSAPKSDTNWYSFSESVSYTYAGVPWTCKKNCGTPQEKAEDFERDLPLWDIAISNKKISDGWNYLKQLFGKVYNVYEWSGSEGYKPSSCISDSKSESKSDSKSASENAACFSEDPKYKPVVYSFDSSKKLANKQFKLYQANRVVINDSADKTISIDSRQLTATMKFYFWADANQMPITGIEVDWGDGSIIKTTNSMYKNHKPRCAGDDKGAKVPVCSNDWGIVCSTKSGFNECPGTGTGTGSCLTKEPRALFGSTDSACTQNYFEMTHTYVCDQAVCSYNPYVVVTDNWGAQSAKATYGGKIILTP